jgi:hypothetical protein
MDTFVFGCWAVHTRMAHKTDIYFNGGYSVTHVPTGLCLESHAADLSLSQALPLAINLDCAIKRLPVKNRDVVDEWNYVVEAIIAETLAGPRRRRS